MIRFMKHEITAQQGCQKRRIQLKRVVSITTEKVPAHKERYYIMALCVTSLSVKLQGKDISVQLIYLYYL